MVYDNLVKYILDNDGLIQPIYIDYKDAKGTGLCNGSLLYVNDTLHLILRNVEYTLHQCQKNKKYQSTYEGALSYYHRDDVLKLITNNFYCVLDEETLKIKDYKKIDTSKLDTEPIWTFVGLEDARLVYWDNKYYGVGVRRDCNTTGQGRMEFSGLDIQDDNVYEVTRNRIEVENKDSYCEKNWMPIKDKPFHFVKWTNPTEIVVVDISKNTSRQIYLSTEVKDLPFDLRGGSQLIKWYDDTYLAVVHECHFTPNDVNGFKDGVYTHRFVIWNNDWSLKYISQSFNFMTADVEFCIGLEEINDDVVIVFGFQDNGCYAVKVSKKNLNILIWEVLMNVL